MRLSPYKNRIIISTVITIYIFMLPGPSLIRAQSEYCIYDRKTPMVESARESFRNKDYECARWELSDLLAQKKVKPEIRADALVLLAQVNYQMIEDKQEKRSTVRKNLITAFRNYPIWDGELEIRSSEFFNLINDSKDIARRLGQITPDTFEEEEALIEEAAFEEPEKKAWYKKWWVFGSGVGVMALAVVLLTGGEEKTEEIPVLDTLPDFPPSPGNQK
ncbi:MAG: hypothetical protein JXA92_10610 [candidate division Zixibacteria bacterium]|nr:hypothetical protein [candidate division Zixibacteria bacterium]